MNIPNYYNRKALKLYFVKNLNTNIIYEITGRKKTKKNNEKNEKIYNKKFTDEDKEKVSNSFAFKKTPMTTKIK